MPTRIYFIRHEETIKDPNTNASNWILSENGLKKSENLSLNEIFKDVSVIYSSDEVKTVQTISPLAMRLNLPINQLADLGEVRRGDKFLTKEEFELEKFKQLEDLDYPAFGGETSNEALSRFEKTIKKIEIDNKDRRIIVVSHGTILNLYFAKLQNKFSTIKERWQRTEFGAIGLVKDGEVIIDIVKIQFDYPNIKNFLSKNNFNVIFSTENLISIDFNDIAKREIIDAEDTLFSTREEFINNQDNKELEIKLKTCYENMEKIEKKYFPYLQPLVKKINKFYENRKTEYKFQIFLNTDLLTNISISPNSLLLKKYKNEESFRNIVFQEFKDFDKFLESEI